MKRTLSIIFCVVAFATALCLTACNKSEKESTDSLAGTSWTGVVTYKSPQGTFTGTNTLAFKEGNRCYNAYYEEEAAYTLSSDKTTVSMKYTKGSCTFVINGKSGLLSGSDTDGVTYQGTLTKQ